MFGVTLEVRPAMAKTLEVIQKLRRQYIGPFSPHTDNKSTNANPNMDKNLLFNKKPTLGIPLPSTPFYLSSL